MSTFRTKIETTSTEEALPTGEKSPVSSHIEVDIPYTDYEEKNSHPFIVDHYEIGDFWDKDKAYTLEALAIDNFIRQRIKNKEITNSVSAVKDYFKDLEVTLGVKSYDPLTTKVSKLLDYIKTMSY